MARPDNHTVCDEFRKLLTEGFHVPEGSDRDAILAATKPWRGDIWRAFAELERRLCPFPERRPAKVEDAADD
jgi:hypothetical protein